MNKYRRLFPFFKHNKKTIYLDSAASGLKLNTAIKAQANYLATNGTNVGRTMYQAGLSATNAYEKARAKVASFLNAAAEEIIFTSGTTEGLNIAAWIVSNNLKPGDNIIISKLEHNSSLLPWLRVAKEKNLTIKFLPFNEKGLCLNELPKLIDDKTKVIIISLASNILGTYPDLNYIHQLAQKNNIIVIGDGAQYIPHQAYDAQSKFLDFLAFSGHKLYAPTGIGVLYINKTCSLTFPPYKVGGGMLDGYNENNAPRFLKPPYLYEAGTPLIGQAIGLANAITTLTQIGLETINRIEHHLLSLTLQGLKNIPEVQVINPQPNSPIVSFIVENIHSHDLTTYLANQNICLRAGFHCAENLLKKLGYPMGCMRVSLAFYNTKKEIMIFLESLKKAINYFKGVGL